MTLHGALRKLIGMRRRVSRLGGGFVGAVWGQHGCRGSRDRILCRPRCIGRSHPLGDGHLQHSIFGQVVGLAAGGREERRR